jgi:hypothetical protein
MNKDVKAAIALVYAANWRKRATKADIRLQSLLPEYFDLWACYDENGRSDRVDIQTTNKTIALDPRKFEEIFTQALST